jgi:DNA-binding MarR family transcriptional regulator
MAPETKSTTQWLSDTQQQAWRGWIDAARRIQTATDRQLKADTGFTSDDYEVLVRLSEAPDHRMRMTDLAAEVTNSPSRLSQRVDRLAREGVVCRVRCAEDGRVWWAQLTSEGFARLEAAAPGHVDEVRRVFISRLTDDEIAFLAEVMSRLSAPDERP